MKTKANRYSIAACPYLDTIGPVTRSFGTDRKCAVAGTQKSQCSAPDMSMMSLSSSSVWA